MTISVDQSTVDLGKIAAAANTANLWRVTPAGAVSRQTGSGIRVGSGSISTPTITVHCEDGTGSTHRCSNNKIYIRVATGSATSPGQTLQRLAATLGTGASLYTASSTLTGANGSTASITFGLNAINDGANASFNLGMDLPFVAYGTKTGLAKANYTVTAGFGSSLTSSVNLSGVVQATSLRPLSISKTSDLKFGRAVEPIAGGASGYVTINASTNARTITGDGKLLAAPAFSRAAYTVSGEGGSTLDVDVPTSFTMSNGLGGTLTVQTNTTAVGIIGTGGALGAAGTYTFYVGGQFPLSSSTASGDYSGTFDVTVSYN